MRQTKGQTATTVVKSSAIQKDALIEQFKTSLSLSPLLIKAAGSVSNPLKRWTPSRFSNSFKHALARRRDFILNACKNEGGVI